MTAYSALYSLHVLAAVIWVGGMFFAWMILRPAAMTELQPAERLSLWAAVLQRFFIWVWVSLITLPVTGVGMWHMRFPSMDAAPRYVHIMAGLFVVMLALFLRLQLLKLPALKRAVADRNWPVGAAAMAQIRRLVGANLLIGLAIIALASMRLAL